MIDLNKVSEGIDYEIVSHKDLDNSWAVEIIRGDYINTGFLFENIQIDGVNGNLTFKLSAFSLRDGNPLNTTRQEIQLYAGAVLEDIIKNGVASGAIELHGQDEDK